MKIQIIAKNSEYGFRIVSDVGKLLYFSPIQYFLTSDVEPSYKYAWEAYRDARKLIRNKPYHLASDDERNDSMTDQLTDVSAEQMLVQHYMSVLDGLKSKVKGSKENKEYGKKVYQEIKLVMKEIKLISEKITDNEDKLKMRKILVKYKKLAKRYFPAEVRIDEEEERKQNGIKEGLPTTTLPTQEETQQMSAVPGPGFQDPSMMAKNNSDIRTAALLNTEGSNPLDIRPQLMEEYSSRICEAIQAKHNNAYCHYDSPEDDTLVVIENNQPILKIRLNKYLHIDSIIPVGKLHRLYPIHSIMFYQKYWKPIVENIKHFCTCNPPVIFVVDGNILPDAGEQKNVRGWNIEEKKDDELSIDCKSSAWFISDSKPIKTASLKESVSQHTEQDYINAIVKCVDPKLESIFERTGAVIQVIPGIDLIEIDVDFGRGLGTVRLTESQIQIVPV